MSGRLPADLGTEFARLVIESGIFASTEKYIEMAERLETVMVGLDELDLHALTVATERSEDDERRSVGESLLAQWLAGENQQRTDFDRQYARFVLRVFLFPLIKDIPDFAELFKHDLMGLTKALDAVMRDTSEEEVEELLRAHKAGRRSMRRQTQVHRLADHIGEHFGS